jgi:hypothetical protein
MAVHTFFYPLQTEVFIPTEAKWRDLLFIIRIIESEWKPNPSLCHPDRSVAKWRDLQFRGPLLEMFSTWRASSNRNSYTLTKGTPSETDPRYAPNHG